MLDAWKVLNYEQFPSGRVAIIGGGLVGAETAEFLAQMGLNVTVIEMLEEIAKEESSTVKPVMFEDFEKLSISLVFIGKVWICCNILWKYSKFYLYYGSSAFSKFR